ncbi:MAG: hypothetical protein Q4G34_01930 [Micrococcus sp.]|nr:hypothetical protein [Micrococcus sp.]
MIKNVLLLSAGAAAGWFGHRILWQGRDAAAVRAEETLRTTLSPENMGRQAGSAAASALAESARSFAAQLREEVPAWANLVGSRGDTITGVTVDPDDAAPGAARASGFASTRPGATTSSTHGPRTTPGGWRTAAPDSGTAGTATPRHQNSTAKDRR